MANSDSNKYELMVIVDPSIGTDAVKKRLEKIKKQISAEGSIFNYEEMGEQEFTFKMRTKSGPYRTKGFYAVFYFDTAPKNIKELEASLRIENEVIRHLVIKLPNNIEFKKMEE